MVRLNGIVVENVRGTVFTTAEREESSQTRRRRRHRIWRRSGIGSSIMSSIRAPTSASAMSRCLRTNRPASRPAAWQAAADTAAIGSSHKSCRPTPAKCPANEHRRCAAIASHTQIVGRRARLTKTCSSSASCSPATAKRSGLERVSATRSASSVGHARSFSANTRKRCSGGRGRSSRSKERVKPRRRRLAG